MKRLKLTAVMSAAMICAFVGSVQAQPLTDRIPGDAIIYLGWEGVDQFAKREAYKKSHLKAVMGSLQSRSAVDDVLSAMVELARKDDPKAAAELEKVAPFIKSLWHRPVAIYVGSFDADANSQDPPRVPLAIIVDAGEDAADIAKKLNELMKDAPDDELRLQQVQGRVALVSKAVTNMHLARLGVTRMRIAPAPGIEDNPRFSKTMKGLATEDPAFAVFVDVAGMRAIMEKSLAGKTDQIRQPDGSVQEVPSDDLANWQKLRDAAGLQSVEGFVMAGGFVGRDWSMEMMLAAPAPRQGLLGRVGQQPIDPASLKVIPATAHIAGATRFDIAGVYDELRLMVQKFDENQAGQLDQGLQQIKQQTGIDVEDGFIRALGSDWVYYADPTVNGGSLLGLVAINHVKDPKTLDATLNQLANIANVLMQQQAQKEDISLRIKQTRYEGVTMNYFATPLISPTWAVRGDKLILGLYPQSVAGAIAELKSPGKSLDVKKIVARVSNNAANGRPISIGYVDTKRMAETSYMNTVMFSRLFGGLIDMTGGDAPAMMVPPLKAFEGHLTPAMSVVWVDDAGIHARSIEPFPGSTSMFSAQQSQVGGAAMALSILLPSLSKAKTITNRTKEASNIRSILQGCHVHAIGHDDQFPEKLGDLVKAGTITPDLCVSPLGGTSVPGDLETVEQQAEWVNKNSDYVYVRPEKGANAGMNTVVLYRSFDYDDNDPTDGIVIGFADGHAKFFEYDQAIDILVKQKLIEDPRGAENYDYVPGN